MQRVCGAYHWSAAPLKRCLGLCNRFNGSFLVGIAGATVDKRGLSRYAGPSAGMRGYMQLISSALLLCGALKPVFWAVQLVCGALQSGL